jgi:VanZ family protein
MLLVMRRLLVNTKDLFSNKIWMLLAFAWSILIFIGCSLPGKELPKLNLFDNVDKVVHFVFFAVLILLWHWAGFVRSWWICIVVCLLYGFGIELYQMKFVAGRSFDIWDGVADTIGGIVAYYVVGVKYKV